MMHKLLDKRGNWNFLSFSDEKRDSIKKSKTIAKTLVSLITSIGAIPASLYTVPAGLYTVNEYFTQQQNRREDRVLELHTKQFEEPLLNIRSDLNFFFSNPNVKKEDVSIEKIEEHSFEYRNDPEKFKKMKILLEYYEGVAKCVKTNNCEESTAIALFKEDVQNFIVVLGPLLCELRKQSSQKDTASDLEEFVNTKNPLCKKDNSYGK